MVLFSNSPHNQPTCPARVPQVEALSLEVTVLLFRVLTKYILHRLGLYSCFKSMALHFAMTEMMLDASPPRMKDQQRDSYYVSK